jgi:NAD(P)-dependent dehydrogenase (short-subunit alcohol dehydrogenase family)
MRPLPPRLEARLQDLIPIAMVIVGGYETCAEKMVARALKEGSSWQDVDKTLRIIASMRKLECFAKGVGIDVVARMDKPLAAGRKTMLPTSSGSRSFSMNYPPRSTTYWSPDPVLTTRRSPNSILKKHVRHVEAHLLLPLQVARHAANKVRPGGILLFMGGTGGRRTAKGFTLISALTAAMPAMTKNLAFELAPVRVNLIAAGFVDTPLSASLLGNQLDARREQLRATLPIGRVVGPADVAALAVHIMTNTALTGATFDIDGGQQLVEG